MPKITFKGMWSMITAKNISQESQTGRIRWLELTFVLIAVVTACVACASLASWSIISFSVPPNVYTIKTKPQKLENGQYLEIEYPNIVMGASEPAEIKFTITGKANISGKVSFRVLLPTGLTLIEPVDQAGNQTGTFFIQKPEEMTGRKVLTF
jgi:hypothetical protein